MLDVSCLIIHFTTHETIEFKIPVCLTRVVSPNWLTLNEWDSNWYAVAKFVEFLESICIFNGVTTYSHKCVLFSKKLAT